MESLHLAKPSGVTLQEHVNNVIDEGNSIINSFPITIQKYKSMVGKDLDKRLRVACKYHDDGKQQPVWQTACRNDYNMFLEWQEKHGGDYLEFCKASNKGFSGGSLMKTGIRHEIFSLIMNNHRKFSMPVQVAIAAHHAKLNNKNEHRWKDDKHGNKGEGAELWRRFKREANTIKDRHDFRKAIQLIYEYSGPRSLLQIADHRASAKESKEILPLFIKFSYAFPHNEKRNVQKIIDEYWQEDLLLVRAPTGAGKTDASLLWAAKQIESGRAERLVIAMPTRFTSNALSINVANSLSDTGLYHSSAWFTKYREQVKSDKGILKYAKKEHELARLLLTPVTVCTIDHLLIALTLTREDHHGVLFNLANSCLVIDEADFYDEFTQANILVLLEALRIWQVPVLIMSASLPESVISTYKQSGFVINDIKEDKSDGNRVRAEITTITEYAEVAELEELFMQCIAKESAIIYANTIDKAFHIYSWLKKKNMQDVTLYHSRFTEPDKKNKEEELINKLGKNAWNSNKVKGIAILTQIGELSINISADIMLTDLCPIDRFVQRVGRLSRFTPEKVGEVHLLYPMKDSMLYPAPYGTYQRGLGWIPIAPLLKTKELLTEKGYSADEFVQLVNEVYPEGIKFSDKAIMNANMLKDHLAYHWLIGPKEDVQQDADDTVHWKSRNIQGNDTVLVKRPDSIYFRNWTDINEFKCENGVDLPLYLIDKGRKNNKLYDLEIFIGEDKYSIIVAYPGVYSSEIGLIFKDEEMEDYFL